MPSLVTSNFRRRRRRSMPSSLRRTIYEWIVMGLLWAAPLIGVVLFGAVRNWSSGGLMVLVFMGVSLFALRPALNRDLLEVKTPAGGLLFLLFGFYAALLIPFAAVPYDAKVEFLKIVSYIGAYFAWTELASRSSRWRFILFLPLLLGTLVALYALIMHVQGSTAVLNLTRHEDYGLRASGTFIAPAHLGAYMGTMICLATALLLTPSGGPLLRLFAGYGLILFLPTLFLSQSRSGWVGTALGMATVLWLLAWRRSRRTFIVTCVAIPLLAGMVFATLWHFSPMFQERAGMALRIEGTAAWRIGAWKDTWQMIQDAPVFGHGPGSYRWIYTVYQQSWPGDRWLRYAHNEYVHLWAEYGVVGVLLMAVLLGVVFFKSLRLFLRSESGREAGVMASFIGVLVAALGHAITDFNLHVFSLVHHVVLIGGVAMAGFYRTGALTARPLPRAVGVSGGIGLALASLWAAMISFQIGMSGALVRLAEDRAEHINLLSPNLYDEAIALNERARRIDPSCWVPYAQLGDIHRSRAKWLIDPETRRQQVERALALYEQAYARNRYDMHVVFGIAYSWIMLGDEEKALNYLRRTVEHWPANVYYIRHLGLHLRRMGHYEEALDVFRKAGGRDPESQSNARQLEQLLREKNTRNPP